MQWDALRLSTDSPAQPIIPIMTQKSGKRRARPALKNAEQIAVRLPGALLKRIDIVAAAFLCPRSLVVRRLLRGLEAETRR